VRPRGRRRVSESRDSVPRRQLDPRWRSKVFVGSFEHTLDEKGRLVLPAQYRAALAEGGVLVPWERYLGLWTPEAFETVAQVIKTHFAEEEEDLDVVEDLFRVFLARSAHVRPDTAGRIVLPVEHRTQIGLDRDAVVTGRLDHIEVWERAAWRSVFADAQPNLARAMKAVRV